MADSFPNLPGLTGSREELVPFECPRPDVAVQEFSSDANFLFLVRMLCEIPAVWRQRGMVHGSSASTAALSGRICRGLAR